MCHKAVQCGGKLVLPTLRHRQPLAAQRQWCDAGERYDYLLLALQGFWVRLEFLDRGGAEQGWDWRQTSLLTPTSGLGCTTLHWGSRLCASLIAIAEVSRPLALTRPYHREWGWVPLSPAHPSAAAWLLLKAACLPLVSGVTGQLRIGLPVFSQGPKRFSFRHYLSDK